MNTYKLRETPNQILLLMDEYNSDCTDERRLEIEDDLLSLEMDFSLLCDSVATLKAECEGEVDVYEKEIARLREKRDTAERKAARLAECLYSALQRKGVDKLKTDIYTFSFRKSDAVVVTDETLIPEEFRRIKYEESPDKALIKDALKEGVDIPGAFLDTRKHLQIK